MILIIGGAYQGKRRFAEETLGIKKEHILYGLSEQLRTDERDIDDIAESICQNPDIHAVVCDEVGCGIVPINESDRVWRERVGRVSCAIAKRADEVYTVQCGIGTQIKGFGHTHRD